MSMYSRIFFTIGTDTCPDVEDYCDVRETIAPRHSSRQVEVSPPHSYQGPYDHQAFTHGIAAYYAKFLADTKETVQVNSSLETGHDFTFESQDGGHR